MFASAGKIRRLIYVSLVAAYSGEVSNTKHFSKIGLQFFASVSILKNCEGSGDDMVTSVLRKFKMAANCM